MGVQYSKIVRSTLRIMVNGLLVVMGPVLSTVRLYLLFWKCSTHSVDEVAMMTVMGRGLGLREWLEGSMMLARREKEEARSVLGDCVAVIARC